MGSTKKRDSESAATEAAGAKRKRRRRTVKRTEVSSSESSSSSSESESSSGEEEEEEENIKVPVKTRRKEKKTEGDDVEMKDAEEDTDSGSEGDAEDDDESKETIARIPPALRDFDDPLAAQRFEEYYLSLATSEFGDDLFAVREAKDFDGAKSMKMLVRAIKQGVNIFDADEKRTVVSAMAAAEAAK